MSRQNLELAQRAREAYERGDIDAALEFAHPQLEWVIAREHPEARTLVGREAVAAYHREWLEMLNEMRLTTDRIVDAGDSVVVIGRVSGVGSGSGAELGVPMALVERFADGKIVHVAEYLDPAEALRAAGAGS
jgi:uncharacterized protein